MVHRLVLYSFNLNEYFEGAVVNHKDGNKLNNSLDNLEWCTIIHNNKHAIETGLKIVKYGEDVKTSKLKQSDIQLIKTEYEKTKNYTKVSKMFGVSSNTIKKIITGKSWNTI